MISVFLFTSIAYCFLFLTGMIFYIAPKFLNEVHAFPQTKLKIAIG